MRSRQIAERLGVEEAHMLEFQQFNALWDRRMAEFEQKSADLEEAMKERHGTELMEYIRNAQSEPLRLPCASRNPPKLPQTCGYTKHSQEQASLSCTCIALALNSALHAFCCCIRTFDTPRPS
jgi:hypothetical protein